MKSYFSVILLIVTLFLGGACAPQDKVVSYQALEESRGTALSSSEGIVSCLGGKSFTAFTAPITWGVEVDQQGEEWLQVGSVEEGRIGSIGTTSIYLEAGMNVTGESRQAVVRFVDEEGVTLQSLPVSQAPVTFKVSVGDAILEPGNTCQVPFEWDCSLESNAPGIVISVEATIPWQVVQANGQAEEFLDTLRTNPGVNFWLSCLKGDLDAGSTSADIQVVPFNNNTGDEVLKTSFDIIPVWSEYHDSVAQLGVYSFTLEQSFEPKQQ